MIPFSFEYYRPKTIKEAVELYQSLSQQGKKPRYFSGGTEIITLGRLNLVETGAVIDIKRIPECRVHAKSESELTLGAGLSLTEIEDKSLFPLLSKTVSEIADHTARMKITVGGNITGFIFYREAVLPFLLTDSMVTIAGPNGVRKVSINQVFEKELMIDPGELLVQLHTKMEFINAPFISIKRRKQWITGYPLITVNAIKIDQQIRVAISGLCPFPFRSKEIERILNNKQLPSEKRAKLAVQHLPSPILDDVEGTAQYRLFVLKNTLSDIVESFEGVGE